MADEIIERLVVVEQTTKAAHSRLDKFEASVATDLKEINQELKNVLKWMYEREGAEKARDKMMAKIASAAALVGALIGACLQYVPLLFKK